MVAPRAPCRTRSPSSAALPANHGDHAAAIACSRGAGLRVQCDRPDLRGCDLCTSERFSFREIPNPNPPLARPRHSLTTAARECRDLTLDCAAKRLPRSCYLVHLHATLARGDDVLFV